MTSFYGDIPANESYHYVFDRIVGPLTEIVGEVIGGSNILICTHEAPLRMIRMALENMTPDDAIRKSIGNCEYHSYKRY